MPPKKKFSPTEDLRSPLEISIAHTLDQIKTCETQVQQFRDGVHDLAAHTAKIKTLEAEIVPKEAELKTVMHAYHKLVENSVSVSKLKAVEVEPPPVVMPAARAPSRAMSRSASPSAPPGMPVAVSNEEIADRDALKTLSNVMRDCLLAIINPLFLQERTTLELQIEECKEREAKEAAQLTASQPVAAPLPNTAAKIVSTVKPAATSAPQAAKMPSLAELMERVDFELFRPPGLDAHVTSDVLKLRQQRLTTERQLKSLQQQLSYSRQLVARRTNEGASKPALKKAEKNLQFLQQGLRDLERQRDDFEKSRKSEGGTGVAAAAARSVAAKAAMAAVATPSPALPTRK